MSEEMKLSICKSASYGETAEKTAEMHGCTVDEVIDVWDKSPDIIQEYKEYYKGMEGDGV